MHDEDFFLDNHYLEDTEIGSGQLQLRKCRDISHENRSTCILSRY